MKNTYELFTKPNVTYLKISDRNCDEVQSLERILLTNNIYYKINESGMYIDSTKISTVLELLSIDKKHQEIIKLSQLHA